jgi:hypothetical protein
MKPTDVAKADFLSATGRFRSVSTNAIKLANINDSSKLSPETRTCLQYVAADGTSAITSPIWKTLGKIGSRQLDAAEEDDVEGTYVDAPDYQFDKVDEYLAVNLGFALKAGREIADLFGYESIEPLQFDNLMIQLRTVNLPTIPKAVKQTFDVGIPFTHAAAWLIGLTNQTDTLESYMVVRSLLKHLTTKGVYRKGAFEPSAVYKDGMSDAMVEIKSVEEAAKPVELSVADMYEISRIFDNRNRNQDGVSTIGTLYGAE